MKKLIKKTPIKKIMPEWKKKEIAALNKAIKNNIVDAPDMPYYC